jgi:hypothetical protein
VVALKTIFERIDEYKFHIGNFYPANIFKNTEAWANYFKVIVCIGLFFWMFFGLDSVIEQLYPLIYNFGSIITLKADYPAIWQEMMSTYGKGSHFSAVVIYGISWLILQWQLEKQGIIKSFNFFMSMMLTLLNMGIFETAWNRTCAYFQNLPWLLMQPTNIVQYNAWIAIGLLAVLLIYASKYKLNITKYTLGLVVLSLAIWVFWIYYPFPIHQISVETVTGYWWHSTKFFPQTLYTVDLDPTDNIYKGVFFYVENNWIHLTNVVAKIVITTTIMALCCAKKVTK